MRVDSAYNAVCAICLARCGRDPGAQESSQSTVQCLGVNKSTHELAPYVFEQSITSEVVIACIDRFSQTCEQRTVIVMDQASIHISRMVEAKREEWKQKNIEIFWLPTYSPQLNLIEILWRFMKYEWIELDVYES